MRAIGVAAFALAVLVIAGAAALGEIDAAPVWLAAGGTALAAMVAQLLPEGLRAARKRRARADEERQATAQLDAHLDAVQRRFRDHMAWSNPFEAQENAAGFLHRLVRVRDEAQGRESPARRRGWLRRWSSKASSRPSSKASSR